MTFDRTRISVRRGSPIAYAVATVLSAAAAMPAQAQQALEEVIVTAQRRETSLQTTPIAITAYTGEKLAEDKIFTVADLANSVPSFSLTALTPLDLELNIRGITNTRLDSPTADPSVGTFVDGVYIGRTGDYNFDFYDLERIEVIRGPQGVLLGKNVVGGALSIITAAPKFDNSGEASLSFGNYNAITASGHATGGLTDDVAGRVSFQARTRDGYARDILHQRDVEDLTSYQGRAQLLWEPADSGWSVRGIADYSADSTNGINTVAVEGGTVSVRNQLPAHELHASLEQPARVPRHRRPARKHRAEHPVQEQVAHQPVHGSQQLGPDARRREGIQAVHVQFADRLPHGDTANRCMTRRARAPRRSTGACPSGRPTSPG